MRLGFIQMLIASLALHASVVGGLALAFFHSAPPLSVVAPETREVTLLLLRSQENPDFHQAVAVSTTPPVAPIAPRRAIALLSPTRATIENKIATPPRPPALALEANPNAHIRALPPEAVLSPVHAPHLDGHVGVVFLLDISGSMYEPYAGSTRLAYARQTLAHRIGSLQDGTPFAITLYAETARNSGPLVAASEATRAAAIRFIMENVDCGGGTDLPAGLASAGELQAGNLVLVTDGDLNISQPELKAKANQLLGLPGQCPSLTIVGIDPRLAKGDGRLLQSLATAEEGTYHVEQFTRPELVTMNPPELAPR